MIELLVVLAALAVLLSIATPRYLAHLDHAREQALRHNLRAMRLALEQYRSDRGQSPADLTALVNARYLREVPTDPMTERRDTWVPVVAAGPTSTSAGMGPGVLDVRSGAAGIGSDGTPYASW